MRPLIPAWLRVREPAAGSGSGFAGRVLGTISLVLMAMVAFDWPRTAAAGRQRSRSLAGDPSVQFRS